jgi:F-type H+-transporting ATPase subunit b
MGNLFIPVAFASETESARELTTGTETTAKAEEHSGGLSIEPSTVAFQALNFLVLLILLKMILYKPLMQVMKEREKRINDGIENADKADRLLQESEETHKNILKTAKVESHSILESAKKDAESTRSELIQQAQAEADKLIENGRNALEMEKGRAAQELKNQAVNLVMLTAEKILKEKLDPERDRKMIEESLNSYSQ